MDRSLLTAALIMSLGMLFIPFGDTAGKMMTSAGVAPLFVAWARFGIGIFIILPFALHRALPGLLAHPRIWCRSLLQALTISTILTALSTEPIANVFGAFFLGPMVSYILSIWLLREQGSLLRTLLLIAGLVGVMLVVRPGFGMTPGLGWALLSGCFYGMFLTASRWVAPLGKPTHLLAAQLIIGTLILTPLGVINMPAQLPYLLMGWSALASMLGNLLLVFAYARAGASTLAPFVYVQLIGAAAYGLMFFGDVPDAVSALGILIIFVSGTATLFIRKPPTRPAP